MFKQRIMWSSLLVCLLLLIWPGGLTRQVAAVSRLDRLVNQLEGPLPSMVHAQTPLSPVAAAYPLAATYYYQFSPTVAADLQPLFEEAIAVFNRTGLVHLRPGQAKVGQNSLTLFTYDRPLTQEKATFVELGEGGPTVDHHGGWRSRTVNHARAGLNLAHPEMRLRVSVAIHEIGHALGLAHSESQRSIMYPLDQLQETLSPADLRALRLLYPG